MRYLIVFSVLFLSMVLSPLHAQKKTGKTPRTEFFEPEILEIELEPDYTSIIKRATGVEDVKKISFSDSYLVSFGKERECRNQIKIAQVTITETNDTVVSFISDQYFSSVGDYFYKDYLEVAIYDSVDCREYNDLLHKSGKVLGNFQYYFLRKEKLIYEGVKNPRSAFYNGLLRVEKRMPFDKYIYNEKSSQKRSFIDSTGRIITDSLLYDAYFLNDSLAAVAVYNPNTAEVKYGCINWSGELVIPFEYSSISPFKSSIKPFDDNNFIVAEDRSFSKYLFDKQGKLLVDGVSSIMEYSDTLWLVLGSNFNDNSCYFNPKSRKILSKRYIWVSYRGSAGLPSIVGLVDGEPRAVFALRNYKPKSTYGLVDTEGNEILPVIYDGLSYFNDYRLSLVSKENKVAWVNEKGKIISGWFDRSNKFEEPGIAWVCNNKKWALINLQGEIISDWFEKAWVFSEGLAPVRVNKKVGCIDQSGNMVIQPQYLEIGNFKNGYALVKSEGDKDKVGVINRKGELVLPADNYEDNEIELKLKELELNL